jgi:hypothetical protein
MVFLLIGSVVAFWVTLKIDSEQFHGTDPDAARIFREWGRLVNSHCIREPL